MQSPIGTVSGIFNTFTLQGDWPAGNAPHIIGRLKSVLCRPNALVEVPLSEVIAQRDLVPILDDPFVDQAFRTGRIRLILPDGFSTVSDYADVLRTRGSIALEGRTSNDLKPPLLRLDQAISNAHSPPFLEVELDELNNLRTRISMGFIGLLFWIKNIPTGLARKIASAFKDELTKYGGTCDGGTFVRIARALKLPAWLREVLVECGKWVPDLAHSAATGHNLENGGSLLRPLSSQLSDPLNPDLVDTLQDVKIPLIMPQLLSSHVLQLCNVPIAPTGQSTLVPEFDRWRDDPGIDQATSRASHALHDGWVWPRGAPAARRLQTGRFSYYRRRQRLFDLIIDEHDRIIASLHYQSRYLLGLLLDTASRGNGLNVVYLREIAKTCRMADGVEPKSVRGVYSRLNVELKGKLTELYKPEDEYYYPLRRIAFLWRQRTVSLLVPPLRS